MARKNLPYRAGDWIAVPLKDGGYGVGKIRQADLKGGITGYFFGPRRPTVPALSELADLRCDDAIYVSNFGDLGLINGEWLVIGGHDISDSRDWPTPAFGRLQNPPPAGWRIIYKDDNTNEPASIEPISIDECLALPPDGVDGAGAVQIVLTRLLSGLDIHDSRRKTLESWTRQQQQQQRAGGVHTPSREPTTPRSTSRDNALGAHAVLVHLPNASENQAFIDHIEDTLIEEIDAVDVGQFDGVERDLRTGEVVLFTYGPDADRLAAVTHRVLTRHSAPAGTYLIKRYGGPGEREARIDLVAGAD